jgi:outer membrane biosynthesis protein TonB
MIALAVTVTGCAQLAPAHRSQPRAMRAPPVDFQHAAYARQPTGAPSANAAAATASVDGSGGQAAAAPAPPEPLSPFDDAPVIFTVAGQHFSRGERTIVTVCLGPNHSIASADIFESSGDSKFDQLAVMWARRIRLRDASEGQQVASCGAVRVEVRPSQEPRMFHAPADTLS